MFQLAAVVMACGVLAACSTQSPPDGYIALFNGKDLVGWERLGGEAIYTVEGGAIVGATKADTPNTFLASKERYSDFILELEFKIHPKLNSGIQIRSNVYDEERTLQIALPNGKTRERVIPAGKVHGYQVEIDPDAERGRVWTGGIHDEGRRGAMVQLAHQKDNEQARQAFKHGDWNHYRIQCQGDSIKTWLNGVLASDITDDLTSEGFIALQVHHVDGDAEQVGRRIRWRNLYLKDLSE